MIFNTFQQSWKMLMHLLCLSVCAGSNFRKILQRVFKFMHAIHVWYRVDNIENDMHGTRCSFTERHKSFMIHFDLSKGVKFLKFIVTYLYCTKYNEIKYFIHLYRYMFYIQDHSKYFWYIMDYAWKQLDMYFKLCFMVCFILLNFNALYDVYTVLMQSYTVLL